MIEKSSMKYTSLVDNVGSMPSIGDTMVIISFKVNEGVFNEREEDHKYGVSNYEMTNKDLALFDFASIIHRRLFGFAEMIYTLYERICRVVIPMGETTFNNPYIYYGEEILCLFRKWTNPHKIVNCRCTSSQLNAS